jgi:hypothetical protein
MSLRASSADCSGASAGYQPAVAPTSPLYSTFRLTYHEFPINFRLRLYLPQSCLYSPEIALRHFQIGHEDGELLLERHITYPLMWPQR